jgi:hypothetical protein
MTDDRPPIDSSDEELVSAYLDGEATPAERERVEADPQLLDLVDAYRSAAAAVGSPVMPLDQPRRDAMVSAALAVLDDRDARPDAGRPSAEVAQLSARRRWTSRAPGLAAAAAILFLVGIGLVLSSNGSDRDQQAEVSASADRSTSEEELKSQDATGGAAEDGDSGSTGPGAASEAEPDQSLAAPEAPLADLGDFTDEASLRDALAGNPPPSSTTRESAPDTGANEHDAAADMQSEAARCVNVVRTTDAELGDLLAIRTATLGGEPVLVFSHAEREKPDRIIDTVTDRGSCRILFAQAR